MRHLRHLRPGAPQRDFLFGEYQEGDPSSSRTYTGPPQRRMAFVGKGGARELAEFSE